MPEAVNVCIAVNPGGSTGSLNRIVGAPTTSAMLLGKTAVCPANVVTAYSPNHPASAAGGVPTGKISARLAFADTSTRNCRCVLCASPEFPGPLHGTLGFAAFQYGSATGPASASTIVACTSQHSTWLADAGGPSSSTVSATFNAVRTTSAGSAAKDPNAVPSTMNGAVKLPGPTTTL